MCVPWDGNQRYVWGFFHRGHEKSVLHFSSAEPFFCVKQVHGARTRVVVNPCTTIEERIHNALHTPAPCASSPGSRRMLHQLPPMSLVELRVHFSMPWFSWQNIIISRTCHFMCPSISASSASQQERQDVRCVTFLAKLIKKHKNVRPLGGIILCNHVEGKNSNLE